MSEEVKSLDLKNQRLTKRLHNMYWTIGISTLGAAISSPLIVEGVLSKNSALFWSGMGVGTISVITILIKNFM